MIQSLEQKNMPCSHSTKFGTLTYGAICPERSCEGTKVYKGILCEDFLYGAGTDSAGLLLRGVSTR